MSKPTFGSRFLDALRKKGLSQAQAAKLLSTTPGFVSDVVNDVKKPGLEFLQRAQEALGISIDWLISGGGVPLGAPFDIESHRLIVGVVELVHAAIVDTEPDALSLLDELLGTPSVDQLASPHRLEQLQEWSVKAKAAMLAAAIHNALPQTEDLDARLRQAIVTAVASWQLLKRGAGRPELPQYGSAEAPGPKRYPHVILNVGHNVRSAGRDYRETTKDKGETK